MSLIYRKKNVINLFSILFFSFSCLTARCTCCYGTFGWGTSTRASTSGSAPSQCTPPRRPSSWWALMLTRYVAFIVDVYVFFWKGLYRNIYRYFSRLFIYNGLYTNKCHTTIIDPSPRCESFCFCGGYHADQGHYALCMNIFITGLHRNICVRELFVHYELWFDCDVMVCLWRHTGE